MTVDDLLKEVDEFVEKKMPLSPQYWIEMAQKLVVLSSSETDLLYRLQKEIAQEKTKHISSGKSVAESKLIVEGTDLYESMQKQKAKVLKVEEIIRIAKIQSRMKQSEFFGGSL